MMTERDDTTLRRYLLGELPDQECAALEHEYFAAPDALDRVQAAEDELIDEYLSGHLSAHERKRFEQHYLAAPLHRTRLSVARELRTASGAIVAPTPAASQAWWMVAAAALLLLAVGSVWMVRSRVAPTPVAVTAPPATTPPQVSAPSAESTAELKTPVQSPTAPVIALTLSPVSVRGTGDDAILTIPPGGGLVVLRLEGDPAGPPLKVDRALIRTVSGDEIWRGPATVESGTSPPAVARLDIPAATLGQDDYIVVLFEADRGGKDVEGYRYFLRVRSP